MNVADQDVFTFPSESELKELGDSALCGSGTEKRMFFFVSISAIQHYLQHAPN
jgi:hypothetical protein